jgi:hypothetical protein
LIHLRVPQGTILRSAYRNVTCTYDLEGLTEEQQSVLKAYVPKRLLIVYELTTRGNEAADSVMEALSSTGIEGYRIEIPKGLDVNAFAVKEAQHKDALGQLIRKASWIGKERINSISRWVDTTVLTMINLI